MSTMVKRLIIAGLFLLLAVSEGLAKDACKAVYGQADTMFTLATGSPGELGLLEELAAAFNAENGSSMCWRKAGSGKSLSFLKNKEVDIVMVHAPAAEKRAVEEGWAIKRTLIGSNEFYIVGPKDDPAGISKAGSAAEAYKLIAEKQSPFLSRGDNSGTNKKELRIWKSAGIAPEGAWYVITKDFMMATLVKADEIGGYFMTDSSTWVAGKKGLTGTAVLFKGDPVLINTYHGLCQPEGATPAQGVAEKFIGFLSSDAGQKIIGTYGEAAYGEPMYNDAEYAKKYEH